MMFENGTIRTVFRTFSQMRYEFQKRDTILN